MTASRDILQLPFESDDTGDLTIGAYLANLLCTLLLEEESFNGKRPFGNSGWMGDLCVAMIKAGLVDGAIDEDGYLVRCDDDTVVWLLSEAVVEALLP